MPVKACKKRAMNPADRDSVDVGDKLRALILRNLLKGNSGAADLLFCNYEG